MSFTLSYCLKGVDFVSVADRIEKAVCDILPVYGYTPEFSADNVPEKYIVYNITEKGADYSEGENHANEYLVSLNIFTPRLDFDLYEEIKTAMYGAGFCYSSGGETGTDAMFPYITHYYLDFTRGEERA